jgi:hypothetical protein
MARKLTPHKAAIMLHEGTVKGHPLTARQRRFFGAVASGEVPRTRLRHHVASKGKPHNYA